MVKVYVGDLIRKQRAALGMSQSDLCEGICEIATISRLENGSHTPSYKKIKALLEKLGLPDDLYKVVNSQNELVIEDMEKSVRDKVIAFEQSVGSESTSLREDALTAIQALEDYTPDPLVKQRLVHDRVILGKPDGPYAPEEQREILLETLRMTLPRFELDKIGQFRYTQEEISLVNQIANSYAQSGESQTAILIYRQLLRYIQENNCQLSRYAGQLSMVSLNYAIELAKTGQYEEALEVAEVGRKVCVEYGRHQSHPCLLHAMAECQHRLGNDPESRELYTQANYLYKAFEMFHNWELLKKDAEEQVGLIFE